MALASAAVVLPAAAVTLMAMALQLSVAAATTPIGQPGCNTTCGNVSVPYPFGFGPSRCYWPGLNLTCDTSHHPPQLLLGDGSLRVAEISLSNKTVRVMRTGSIINTTGDSAAPSWNVTFGRAFTEHGYLLSFRNELIVSGCNVAASLLGDDWHKTPTIVGGCATFCNSNMEERWAGDPLKYYCQATLTISSAPKGVQAKWMNGGNHMPVNVFVAEKGWVDENRLVGAKELEGAPLLLDWMVTRDLPQPDSNAMECPQDVRRKLCKSKHSDCSSILGYTCHCEHGYAGNPYLAGGCQDVDECMLPSEESWCFGECTNTIGSYYCRCPRRTLGNPNIEDGCIPYSNSTTGLIIGLSVASGPALLLLVLGIILVRRKVKQHRTKALKQKYFNQNRGQLLQQLVSQNADIPERMIIPVDELAKATDNFDKAREIGGGGHGTVYKGILLDLNVVAIKKSKITLQKEIDEFINEVAILSQINHKNVVKLFGCCLETEVPLLVYEFIPNGTLDQHLHTKEPGRSLSWSNRLRIATEIATSLAYLHSSVSIPIIHRDIKTANILLDATMTSKISDFGASRYNPTDKTGLTTRIQGTFGYLDPECFYTGRLTEKSDVYSFGVILVELLTRKKPNCSHLHNEGGGLVPHFAKLLASGNLVQIMDEQVLEEGGTEVLEVAMLAASCIKLRGEERPTMRQVEVTLEGLQQGSNKKYKKDDMVTEEFNNGSTRANYSSWYEEGHKFEELGRRYSLEQEMVMSASYSR